MITKLEGPAQQRCGVCDWPIVDNGTRVEHIGFDHPAVPATPTPSPPAGAREWLKETRDWDRHGRGYIRKSDGRLELLDDTLEAYARQQTAAKDAELKACWNQLCEIGFMFDVVTPENNLRLAEIVKHKKEDAERERDSLREALKPISNTVAYLRKAYSAGADAEVVHAITDLQRYCTTVDAALKAGKGDEDGLRH